MPSRPVFLLTDFGPASVHVGIMKAVVTSLDPEIHIHDLAHDLEAGAVAEAAVLLEAAWPYLPRNAVVVAVVDPGVGGPRRVLAARSDGRTLIAPDNGLLSGLHHLGSALEIREIRRTDLELPERSHTFHGRDVFAPVAAHLARGLEEASLGPQVLDPVILEDWAASPVPGGVAGRVVHVDRFGNLLTSITRAQVASVAGSGVVRAGGRRVSGLVRTYSDVAPGSLLAYLGSSGRLEIAVRNGRAAQTLGLGVGAEVAYLAEEPAP